MFSACLLKQKPKKHLRTSIIKYQIIFVYFRRILKSIFKDTKINIILKIVKQKVDAKL